LLDQLLEKVELNMNMRKAKSTVFLNVYVINMVCDPIICLLFCRTSNVQLEMRA